MTFTSCCSAWSGGLFVPCGAACVPRADCPLDTQANLLCRFTTYGVAMEVSTVVPAEPTPDYTGVHCTTPSGYVTKGIHYTLYYTMCDISLC